MGDFRTIRTYNQAFFTRTQTSGKLRLLFFRRHVTFCTFPSKKEQSKAHGSKGFSFKFLFLASCLVKCHLVHIWDPLHSTGRAKQQTHFGKLIRPFPSLEKMHQTLPRLLLKLQRLRILKSIRRFHPVLLDITHRPSNQHRTDLLNW